MENSDGGEMKMSRTIWGILKSSKQLHYVQRTDYGIHWLSDCLWEGICQGIPVKTCAAEFSSFINEKMLRLRQAWSAKSFVSSQRRVKDESEACVSMDETVSRPRRRDRVYIRVDYWHVCWLHWHVGRRNQRLDLTSEMQSLVRTTSWCIQSYGTDSQHNSIDNQPRSKTTIT